MKLKALTSMIYGGKVYHKDDIVDILETNVIKSCLGRGIVEEIKTTKEKVVDKVKNEEITEEVKEKREKTANKR